MKVSILAATDFGHEPSEWEVKDFAGICARVCYLPKSLANVLAAATEKNVSVAELTLQSGHHSVYDHVYVTLALEGAPKILAMTLNNEHVYTTSEQSGRYTKLTTAGLEAELYHKWQVILQGLLAEEMPGLPEKKIEKLALENARYFISVFTPATTMVYTCSIRQLNYLHHWMTNFCQAEVFTDFERRLQVVLRDFCKELETDHEELLIPGLHDNKYRGLSLFAEWRRWRMLQPAIDNGVSPADLTMALSEDRDEWGARGYSTSYWGSFAQLAQAHRHRTLHYEMRIPYAELASFYVPPIIPEELTAEWLDDMESVSADYPQGMLVRINESGRLEDLVQKCQERLCGEAQLEICAQTLATVKEYYRESMWGGGRWNNPFVAAVLQPYAHATGCARMKLANHKCTEPCWWIRHGVELEERSA